MQLPTPTEDDAHSHCSLSFMQHSPGNAEPGQRRNKRSETPLADDVITHVGSPKEHAKLLL